MNRARLQIWLAVAGVASLGGCTVGQSAGSFVPAKGPQGVRTELQFGRAGPVLRVEGELLAVPDSGLFVLTQATVLGQPGRHALLFARWAALEKATFDQMGVRIQGGKPPSSTNQEELARVSRFPQGLSPGLLTDLLAAYGLEEVYVPDSGVAGGAGER